MKRKKICFVLPTLTGGGMERVMSELANYFASLGHEVTVIFLINHTPFYQLHKEVDMVMPEVISTGKRSIWYWLKILVFLRQTILKIQPDTVLSIPQGYSNLTICALLGSGIPVYVSDRNSPVKPLPWKNRMLRRIFYPFAAGIISQTQTARTKLISSGLSGHKITVIPNPLKNMTYYPKESDSRIILNVGRLVEEKNQRELIEIFSKIRQPDWKLHIIGEGPLKQQLLDQIRDLNLIDRVHIFDAVTDIDFELSKASIFAFTSIYEGFPNALNEAMSLPLACIAYDCVAGPGEMIIDGVNGFLVRMHDQEEFVRKLERLINEPELRSTFNETGIKNRVKFSMQSIGKRYLSSLLNTK